MDANSVRRKIAQDPLTLTQLDKVPTLLHPQKEEAEGRFYALLLGLAITVHLEKGLTEEAKGLSSEMEASLLSKEKLFDLTERAWGYLVYTGYWIPYYLIAYGLEIGGEERALETASFYRKRKDLGFFVLDALVLARGHIAIEFGKKS
jgi:hypothetical protein